MPHDLLISAAYAQAGGGQGGQDLFGFFMPLVLIFAIFYFLLIRPQNKKMREHKRMIESLRRGDKVVTGGGIIGSVSKVDSDAEVTIEIADGVRIKVLRQTIGEVLNKPQPADKPDNQSTKAAKKK